jgi:hypothetical protein
MIHLATLVLTNHMLRSVIHTIGQTCAGTYSRLHVKLPTRFRRIFLIGPNSVTISSGALNTTTRTNTRNSVSILLRSPPTQILPPGESTMGVPLAALPPLRVVEAML